MRAISVTKADYLKVWIMTARPKTLILSVSPFLIATLMAIPKTAHIDWLLMIFAMLSALFIQVGTNFINDVYDFKNKADKPTRLGPKRGIQNGFLTPSQVLIAALSSFAAALILGIPLVLKGGFVICLILLISVACGYLYTGGPKPLAYKGLGELFVLVFFGLISTLCGFYFQTGFIEKEAIVIGLQLGSLACVPIAINNLRDIKDDATVNKKTLAVRFGKAFARVEIAALILFPFLLNICFQSSDSMMGYLPCFVLPLGISMIVQIWKTEPSEAYNVFLAQSILLYALFGTLLVASAHL